LVVLPFLIACHPGELAEGVTAATVGWTVEAGKGVLHGAHEGLDRGRAGAKSVDGAEVIVDADAAHTALRWEVVGVVATPYATTVRLGVENVQDTPVRVAVLSAPDTLVIDVDGFAHRLGTRLEARSTCPRTRRWPRTSRSRARRRRWPRCGSLASTCRGHPADPDASASPACSCSTRRPNVQGWLTSCPCQR
jgi:hypothetical protein